MSSLSMYTVELGEEICRRLSEGEPLRAILRSDDKWPSPRTISNWRKAHPAFDEAFLQARDDGYDAIAERVRMTARGKSEDAGGDSSGDVQRDKLIVDTDLKLLAKWDPRRYGEKLDLNHGGKVETSLMVTFVESPRNGSSD